MSLGVMEERVNALLKVWKDWSIYPLGFISGLDATFHRKTGDLKEDNNESEEEKEGMKAEELMSLRREAKQNGLFISDQVS